MKIRTAMAALALVTLATGCSLGGKPPRTLLTLYPAAQVAAGTGRTAAAGETMTVAVPTAPAALATVRVPVYASGPAIAYVKGVAWNDTPAKLLQAILSETIAAQTGRVVLDVKQTIADPGTRLTGQLVQFGIDATRNEAVVTYDAALFRDGGAVSTRRFEARRPVATVEATTVGTPLTEAANDVAAQVAKWIR